MSESFNARKVYKAQCFVTACYRVLLGREPDPQGLAYHAARFQVSSDYQDILEAFYHSTEFKNRQLQIVRPSGDTPTDYYYFFHIPKTAGLTVKAYLNEAIDSSGPQLFPGVFVKDLLNKIETVRKYAFFSGHFMGFLDPLLRVTTHKATLLRDPVDRAISHYFHALRDPSLPLHAKIVGRPLADILNDELTRGFAVNYHAKYLAALVDDASWLEHTLHFRSWPKSDQDLLEKAQVGLSLMDVVGLHEDLPSFFRRLSEHWPIRYLSSIPKVNVGDNRDNDLLSVADLQLIREVNQVDYMIYEKVKNSLQLVEQG